MRTRNGLLRAALAAMVVLTAVGSASASRLSINETNFRIVWTPMTLYKSGDGALVTRCNVTASGSFHSSTFAKVRGLLMGLITSVSAAGCTPLAMVVLTALLPWHLRYGEYEGTLPNIAGLGLTIVGLAFGIPSSACLLNATEASPMRIRMILGPTGTISQIKSDETIVLGCGYFAGAATVTRPSDGGAITISLTNR